MIPSLVLAVVVAESLETRIWFRASFSAPHFEFARPDFPQFLIPLGQAGFEVNVAFEAGPSADPTDRVGGNTGQNGENVHEIHFNEKAFDGLRLC